MGILRLAEWSGLTHLAVALALLVLSWCWEPKPPEEKRPKRRVTPAECGCSSCAFILSRQRSPDGWGGQQADVIPRRLDIAPSAGDGRARPSLRAASPHSRAPLPWQRPRPQAGELPRPPAGGQRRPPAEELSSQPPPGPKILCASAAASAVVPYRSPRGSQSSRGEAVTAEPADFRTAAAAKQRTHRRRLLRRERAARYRAVRRAALEGVRFPEAARAQWIFHERDLVRHGSRAGGAAAPSHESAAEGARLAVVGETPRRFFGNSLFDSRRGRRLALQAPEGALEAPAPPEALPVAAPEGAPRVAPGAAPKEATFSQPPPPGAAGLIADGTAAAAREQLFATLARLNSFDTFRIPPPVLRLALKQKYLTPTPFQAQAIPVVRSGASCMLIGPTGSGKTLAYLLPVMARLWELDAEGAAPFPRAPRALILLPTQELVHQVRDEIVRLDASKRRPRPRDQAPPPPPAMCFGVGVRQAGRVLREAGLDVVAGTPARLAHHAVRGEITFERLAAVVVDEADAMLTPPMQRLTAGFLALARAPPARAPGRSSSGGSAARCGSPPPPAEARKKVESLLARLAGAVGDFPWALGDGGETAEKAVKTIVEKKLMKMQQRQQAVAAVDLATGEVFEQTDSEGVGRLLGLPAAGGRSPPQLILVAGAKTPQLAAFARDRLATPLRHVESPLAHAVPAHIDQTFVAVGDSTRMDRLKELLAAEGVLAPGAGETAASAPRFSPAEKLLDESLRGLGGAGLTRLVAPRLGGTPAAKPQIPFPQPDSDGGGGWSAGSTEGGNLPPPPARSAAVVFTRTVGGCRRVSDELRAAGATIATLHGDLPPAARREAMAAFRSGDAPILVATNVAARGLDLPAVGSVVMYDFPASAAEYLHRAGRTGRGVLTGRVFCIFATRDRRAAREILAAAAAGRAVEFPNAGPRLRASLMAPRDWAYAEAAKSRSARKRRKLKSIIVAAGKAMGKVKRYQVKQEYFRLKAVLEHKRLIRRGILEKDAPLRTRPSIDEEKSEAKSYLRMERNADTGTLQALPTSRNQFHPAWTRRRGLTAEDVPGDLPGDAPFAPTAGGRRRRPPRSAKAAAEVREATVERFKSRTYADAL